VSEKNAKEERDRKTRQRDSSEAKLSCQIKNNYPCEEERNRDNERNDKRRDNKWSLRCSESA
jgi:hypothetical protein